MLPTFFSASSRLFFISKSLKLNFSLILPTYISYLEVDESFERGRAPEFFKGNEFYWKLTNIFSWGLWFKLCAVLRMRTSYSGVGTALAYMPPPRSILLLVVSSFGPSKRRPSLLLWITEESTLILMILQPFWALAGVHSAGEYLTMALVGIAVHQRSYFFGPLLRILSACNIFCL